MVSPEVLIYGLTMLVAVGLVTRERQEGWDIDFTRFHGPNMVICEIVTGIQWTPLIRAYLPPVKMYRLPYLEGALNVFLRKDTIVIGILSRILARW